MRHEFWKTLYFLNRPPAVVSLERKFICWKYIFYIFSIVLMRLTCENFTDVLKRAISVPNETLKKGITDSQLYPWNLNLIIYKMTSVFLLKKCLFLIISFLFLKQWVRKSSTQKIFSVKSENVSRYQKLEIQILRSSFNQK